MAPRWGAAASASAAAREAPTCASRSHEDLIFLALRACADCRAVPSARVAVEATAEASPARAKSVFPGLVTTMTASEAGEGAGTGAWAREAETDGETPVARAAAVAVPRLHGGAAARGRVRECGMCRGAPLSSGGVFVFAGWRKSAGRGGGTGASGPRSTPPMPPATAPRTRRRGFLLRAPRPRAPVWSRRHPQNG
eukprot:364503-Chlamydomonas_euryale.AAC.13